MKKLLTLAIAAILFTTAFAHDGKDCAKKKCTKAEMAKCSASAKKQCCKKEASSATVKATKAVKTVVTRKA